MDRPDTLVEAVAADLRNGIIRGEFAADQRLPEIAQATRLEVSRTTVREALRILADEGLVEIHPHRGAVVSGLTPAVASEISRVRMVLEAFAAREAFARCTPGPTELAPVRAALAQMRRAADEDDLLAYGAADVAFHAAISSLSGNGTLLHMLASLQARARRYVFLTNLQGLDLTSEAASHARLLEALERGEPDRLVELIEAHIEASGARLIERTKSLVS